MIRRFRLAIAVLLGSIALFGVTGLWFSHPICVPLTDQEVAEANVYGALETRLDRQLHGPIWQLRDGRWHHCKSWISRKLFF